MFVELAHIVSLWMHGICAVFQINHAAAGKSPELRTLFFRLRTLLKLPLHAVFVFDGLGHLPDKGHKVRSSPHWIKYVLSPHDVGVSPVLYQAPSEAEAELAAMNVHGVIDAVMTEDSDILIFGTPCIIRRYAVIFLLMCCR